MVLTHLDRELFSPTRGSFDRTYWAWGAIDVSNADAQRFLLPLSFLYACDAPGNPYAGSEAVRQWVDDALRFACREQYANGAFTQWYPNDTSVITAGLLLHDTALAFQLIGARLGGQTRAAVLAMLRRSAVFLLRHEERHGFNSNHQLSNAAGLLDAHALTGEAVFQRRALAILERVLHRQFPSGALCEYEGADPGYQTWGLAFLAACAARHPAPWLRERLAQALEFSSHFLSPVTGSGGCFGSRGTKHLLPSGFEVAARLGVGPDLRATVRSLICQDLGITNRTADLHNLVAVLSDYVHASLAARAAGPPPEAAAHAHAADFFCPGSTLFCAQRGAYGIRGRGNGGMVQVEDLDAGRVRFASAGYVVRTAQGVGFTGVLNGACARDGATITFRALAQRPNRMRQRPALFLLLRLYQLALGWCLPANLALKWVLAQRLIFRRQPLPVRLTRTLTLSDAALIVEDALENLARRPATVRPCREGYISFMGSARYFDASQLEGGWPGVAVTLQAGPDAPPQAADQGGEWVVPARGRLRVRYAVPFTGAIAC